MKKYHHIVLFRIKDGINKATRQKAFEKLQQLGKEHKGLESWTINESTDTRKGYRLIEEALFTTKDDLINFHNSEEHYQVGEFMRTIADWWIGDYEE